MKIDTNKIPGYADMTAEEKLAALEAYETEDVSFDDYVRKDIYNKKASEAAELSKNSSTSPGPCGAHAIKSSSTLAIQ